MNPLVKDFLGSTLRWALQGVFAFLVTKGILTADQGEAMLIGAVGSLVTLLWVLWVKYGNRLKLVTALAAPAGATETRVESMVKAGDSPSVTLLKDQTASVVK